MDKWRVIGAEAQTGSEKSIEVNARDEAGAREAARMLGMLVERIERLREPTGPILSYRSPGTPNRPTSVPVAQTAPSDNVNTPAPPYPAILRSASAVTRMARVLVGTGPTDRRTCRWWHGRDGHRRP